MSKDVLIKKAPLSSDEQREKETIEAVKEGFDGVIDFHQVRAEDIITLTARLAQVLAEEADHLEKMQVSKIAPLQKEKILLSNALALIKKQLPKDGSFMDHLDPQEAESLRDVITVFNEVLEESYTKLSMARAVNQRVVEAITEAVKETSGQDAYDGSGNAGAHGSDSMPLSLDKRI